MIIFLPQRTEICTALSERCNKCHKMIASALHGCRISPDRPSYGSEICRNENSQAVTMSMYLKKKSSLINVFYFPRECEIVISEIISANVCVNTVKTTHQSYKCRTKHSRTASSSETLQLFRELLGWSNFYSKQGTCQQVFTNLSSICEAKAKSFAKGTERA